MDPDQLAQAVRDLERIHDELDGLARLLDDHPATRTFAERAASQRCITARDLVAQATNSLADN